jgi:hypothetical protein
MREKASGTGPRVALGVAATLAGLICPLSASAQIYVSPVGSDTNPGTKSKPFATLERARDTVRALRQAGKLPNEGLTIWLRGGDYIRTNALELSEADSGTANGPIVWRSVRDERVRLLGGRILKGFQPVTNAAILSRLDERARGQVRQLDLRALGITEFGDLKSRGFGRPGAVAHGELFYDHRPMTLARWPNQGEFARIAGYPPASNRKDEHGGQLGELSGGFFYAGDRPRHWQDTSELWVHGYWAYDWANSYEKVAALDLEQRLLKTAPPHGQYGFRKDQRFYFLNVLEELDQPGEWFLERKSGVLYFWPPGETQSAAHPRAPETILSLLAQPLLKLTGASHVTVQGLSLEGTRANGVEIRGGTSNRLAGCLIRNVTTQADCDPTGRKGLPSRARRR